MYGTAGAHYTYDVLDNLTRTIAMNRDQRLCYDQANQLTNVKVNGDCSTGSTILGLGYDPQGNLANWNGVEYAFDYGNRLRSVEGLEAYRYDGHGRRVLATSLQGLGNLLSMYSQAGQLLYQHDVRSNQRREYVFLQGSLVAERSRPLTGSTATVTYQHTDALGTPVAKTNASRVVIQRSEYEPYGKLLNRPLENGPGYTGHVTDAATQLTYMQQRYYDPRVGRFWSVDPVTVDSAGGNFNRYWYANNNPYRFTDPDGRQVKSEPLKSCNDDNTCMSQEQFDRAISNEAGKALNLIGSPIGIVADILNGNYANAGLNAALLVVPELKLGKTPPSAYSVAFETTIERTGIGERAAHKMLANKNLAEAASKDITLANLLSEMGVNPVRGANTPAGFQWHHAVDRPGVMQLVPFEQHSPGSASQWILHPGGRGGFAQWGNTW